MSNKPQLTTLDLQQKANEKDLEMLRKWLLARPGW